MATKDKKDAPKGAIETNEQGEKIVTLGEVNGAPSFVRKITVKLLRGDLDNGKMVGRSCIVGGIARKATPESHQHGDCHLFSGSFELRTPEGQAFVGNKLYLPGVAEYYIADALEKQDIAAPDFQGVQFAIKLTAVKNDKSAVGYEWAFEPISSAEKKRESVLDTLLLPANSEG